jgi:uncharacterized protein YlzI (FlbEa/FlbD family)
MKSIFLFTLIYCLPAQAITLPKGNIVIGDEDDKAVNAVMTGDTKIDHTGKVEFSDEGINKIKEACKEVISFIKKED